MLNNPYFWVILVVVIAVVAPLIGYMIRKKDFNDQVTGKKKERELNRDPVNYSKEKPTSGREVDLRKLDIQQRAKGNRE